MTASAPRPVTVDVAVESAGWQALGDAEELAERAVAAALAVAAADILPGAEVSIVLAGDETVRGLNRQWRGLDKPTNVLSFPAVPPERLAQSPLLGDVILAAETCAREAQDEGKTLADHAAHLIVHGLLHLVGHDHETAEDAEAMEALERAALARLGIADPYADTDPEPQETRAASGRRS